MIAMKLQMQNQSFIIMQKDLKRTKNTNGIIKVVLENVSIKVFYLPCCKIKLYV